MQQAASRKGLLTKFKTIFEYWFWFISSKTCGLYSVETNEKWKSSITIDLKIHIIFERLNIPLYLN